MPKRSFALHDLRPFITAVCVATTPLALACDWNGGTADGESDGATPEVDADAEDMAGGSSAGMGEEDGARESTTGHAEDDSTGVAVDADVSTGDQGSDHTGPSEMGTSSAGMQDTGDGDATSTSSTSTSSDGGQSTSSSSSDTTDVSSAEDATSSEESSGDASSDAGAESDSGKGETTSGDSESTSGTDSSDTSTTESETSDTSSDASSSTSTSDATESTTSAGSDESSSSEASSSTGGEAGSDDYDPSACPSDRFIDASVFVTPPDGLPDPVLEVSCTTNVVSVKSNGIPTFEYFSVTPNALQAQDWTWRFPLNPSFADATTAVNLAGAVAVSIAGLPFYGPTESPMHGYNDPVLDQLLDYCGGHTDGQGRYHFHYRPECLYEEVDGKPSVIVGYAFDGFPIFGPWACDDADCTSVTEVKSSYQPIDNPSRQTAWDDNQYVEGSGDLDECNGRFGADGNYRYYATRKFPYFMGCYKGTPLPNKARTRASEFQQ